MGRRVFLLCVSTIGWHRYVGKMAQNLSDAEFEEKVKNIPVPEQQVKWRRAREGFRRHARRGNAQDRGLGAQLDDHLRDNEWLAGGMYTLADICNFAIANGMQ